jgi:hypothetical protein
LVSVRLVCFSLQGHRHRSGAACASLAIG